MVLALCEWLFPGLLVLSLYLTWLSKVPGDLVFHCGLLQFLSEDSSDPISKTQVSRELESRVESLLSVCTETLVVDCTHLSLSPETSVLQQTRFCASKPGDLGLRTVSNQF
jgi:hypothetical protein